MPRLKYYNSTINEWESVGVKGESGKDYVLTEADKDEIAKLTADLVEIPEQNQGTNVDLTGLATEQWVKDQKYLTEVPDDYAKTEDIPTKPEDIGAQPSGNYLTEIPSGYATEEFVKDKIAEAELGAEEVDLSDYAQKSELPTRVSQLENDKGYLTEHQDISGKLDATALPTAINTALAQAKASGEFDGSVEFQTDETLTLENGILSVNTTNDMEQDNTLPITSAGVFATVGNIEALLKTI